MVRILFLPEIIRHYLFTQTRSKGKGILRCRRPGCGRTFTTSSGRTRHLQTANLCRIWLKTYLRDHSNLNRVHLAPALNGPSSEVGSDEACEDWQRENNSGNYDMQMDLDLGPFESKWEESDGGESESSIFEDASFTHQPLGVDLAFDAPLAESSSSITVEEFCGAAAVLEVLKNRFAQLWESDKLYGSRKIAGPHYPFSGAVEFTGVERFLQYLPMGRINDFLSLEYVRQSVVLCCLQC